MEHLNELDRITMATPEYATLRESMREKLRMRRALMVVVLAHIAQEAMAKRAPALPNIQMDTIERVCRNKIRLIKTMRETHGMGLREGKECVEAEIDAVEKDVKRYYIVETGQSLL